MDTGRYGYVALHGTGTPLGDPIEMGALGQALTASTTSEHSPAITIGSVKSCYGHSEGAAGLTGTLLAIKALSTKVRPESSAPQYMCDFEKHFERRVDRAS